MAKHNKMVSNSELVEKEPLADDKEMLYTNSRALLKLVYPVNVQVTGRATGKLYRWTSAGQVVSVDLLDLEQLLNMKLGVGGCCGGSSKQANKLFQIVEGE